MLSKLAQENNVERMLDILVDKIDKAVKRQQKNDKEIKSPNNNHQEKKIAYKTLQDNLILVAFSWLYYFNHVHMNILFSHLSKSVFELKNGETEKLISSHSLGFVSSMSASTNKRDFAYMLSFFSNIALVIRLKLQKRKK